jgi:hypothetical protein
VPRLFLGFLLVFSCLGIFYFVVFNDEQSDSKISINTQKPTLDLITIQTASSPVVLIETLHNNPPNQEQISHRMVEVPHGALPMETMISKFMADRQRAAKEAVELSPFGSTSEVK